MVPPSSGPSGEIFRGIKLLETMGNYLDVDMEKQTGELNLYQHCSGNLQSCRISHVETV